MDIINFDDFKKIEIRIGKIIAAERFDNSEKLLKLQVDFGPDEGTAGQTIQRQIVSGIAKFYKPEDLIGKECPFAFNLAPKMLNETESQGMILCADNGEPVLLHPDKDIMPGALVK